MAATVSWDVLRDLAGFSAAKGLAVSFYLNLDPAATPTAGDTSTRVNSLLGEAVRQVDRTDLTHDQRQGLKADVDFFPALRLSEPPALKICRKTS